MILSIITPCYNSERYIKDAISSIIAQNNNKIELIIIDDGSSDGTEKICRKYIDKNIRYKRIENSGAGYARNEGIKLARGEWIAFLDSDDLYLINSLNNPKNDLLNTYKEKNIDIIYTPRIKIDMELSQVPQITYPEKIDSIKNFIPNLEFRTCIYNAKFIKDNNIKFYEYKKQDIESAFRFLAFSTAKNIIRDNDFKFYLQRNNLNSNTHTWNLYNLFEVKAKVFYDLYLKSRDKDLEVKKSLLEVVIIQIYNYYILCLKKGYSGEKQQLEEIHALLKSIIECNEIKLFNNKIRIKFNIVILIDRFYKIMFLRKNNNKVIVSNQNKDVSEIKDIFIKLDKVSHELLNLQE